MYVCVPYKPYLSKQRKSKQTTDNTNIPENILKDAEKLFPKPDRSDYHTDTEYDVARMDYRMYDEEYKEYYIQGRMEERVSTQIQVKITHEGRYNEEDMEECWNYAVGKEWDEKNGYHSMLFGEWLEQYKQQKNANNK